MECSLLNQITDEEYSMIHWYLQSFAWDYAHGKKPPASIPYLFRVWDENKKDLFKLLGNNLIISKEFFYKKDTGELVHDFEDRLYSSTMEERNKRDGKEFYNAFFNWRNKAFPYVFNTNICSLTEEQKANKENYEEIRDGLNELINLENIVENCYKGDPFTINLPNGKEFKVNKGCKPMRALAKLATVYDIPGFEDFRIAQSLVTNQANLKGYITLSIHPLDYMTMSDNDCGWESCMSWQEDGCYRQGTVEMMNSPYVVVAYLSSSNDMCLDNYTWNSKKWRELFIVNQDIIMAIKDYPYHNQCLTRTVVDWIKELAETNMDWSYYEKPFKFNEDDQDVIKFNDTEIQLRFYTNLMYNDVFTTNYHWLYVSRDIPEQYDLNYSGLSECMYCGVVGDGHFESESALICNDCDSSVFCHDCGSHVDINDAYEVNGEYYCDDCYTDLFTVCEICEDSYLNEDIRFIFPYYAANGDVTAAHIFGDNLRVCEDCFNEWIKKHVNSKKYYEVSDDDAYYINIEEIDEKGLREIFSYQTYNSYLAAKEDKGDFESFVFAHSFKDDLSDLGELLTIE